MWRDLATAGSIQRADQPQVRRRLQAVDRKLLASEFTRRFDEDNPPDIEDYLRRTYPNIFI